MDVSGGMSQSHRSRDESATGGTVNAATSVNTRTGPQVFAAVVSALLGLAFWYAFYVRYWAWRDCIEQAESGCITPDGDVLIEGGAFWSVPAMFFTLSAVWRLARARREARLGAHGSGTGAHGR
jgi:hypothetical protein